MQSYLENVRFVKEEEYANAEDSMDPTVLKYSMYNYKS